MKRGVFVNVLTNDRADWRAQVSSLDYFEGLDHIEVWLEHLPDQSGIRYLNSLFVGLKVLVHAPFIHLSLSSHISDVTSTTNRRLVRACRVATELSAELVTVHAGSYPVFGTIDIAKERLIDNLQFVIAETDIQVNLENMPFRTGTTPETIAQLEDLNLVATALPNVGLTLDIGHCLQNGEDFLSFVLENAQRISNIHLHDGLRGGSSHLPLGEGDLDMSRFVATLIESGYDDFIGLETISHADTATSWDMWSKALVV